MLATFVTLVGKEVCVFHCISFAEAHCVESGSESVWGRPFRGQSRAKFRISLKPSTIHGSLADLFETRRVLKHLAYFKDNIWLNLKRNSILDLLPSIFEIFKISGNKFITSTFEFAKLSQNGPQASDSARIPFLGYA